MVPKRKARAMVKKTKKVVEETIQVDIIDDSEKAAEIVAEAGIEIGKEGTRDEVVRTTVIIEGDGETEQVGEGSEKRSRVQIPIKSQSLEEPLPVTPRKETEKRGADKRGKEPAKVFEELQDDAGEVGKEVMAEKIRDGAWGREAERSNIDTGKETGEQETEKGDYGRGPDQGLVKTPEKEEVGKTRERDDGGVGRGETKNRKRRKRKGEGIGGGMPEQYKRYIYRVLKQVHPELGISSAAMEVLNAYMNDMFERLVDEAAKLSRYTEKKTLSSREVQSAVRLVLPGELGRHAIAEGAKAVTNYMSYGVMD